MRIILILFMLCVGWHIQAQDLTINIQFYSGGQLSGTVNEQPNIKFIDDLKISVSESINQQIIPLEKILSFDVDGIAYRRQRIKSDAPTSEIWIKAFVIAETTMFFGLDKQTEQELYFIGSDTIYLLPKTGANNFLNYYFRDCSDWSLLETSKFSYTKNELVKLAKTNPSCFNTSGKIPRIDRKKLNINWELLVGVVATHNNSDINRISNPMFSESTFTTKKPTKHIGLSLKLKFNKYFSIEQDFIGYQVQSFIDYANVFPFTDRDVYSEVMLDMNFVESNTILVIGLPLGFVNIHADLGFSGALSAKHQFSETRYEVPPFYLNSPNEFKPQKWKEGRIFGLGIDANIGERIVTSAAYRYFDNRINLLILDEFSIRPRVFMQNSQISLAIYYKFDLAVKGKE